MKSDLRKNYYSDFLYSLLDQATQLKGKYLPVKHQVLAPEDLVLIRDPFLKAAQYPMGVVTKIIKNSLHEVTQVTVRKANKSLVTRDVSDFILLVHNEVPENVSGLVGDGNVNEHEAVVNETDTFDTNLRDTLMDTVNYSNKAGRRAAAVKCDQALQNYFSQP